MLFLVYYSNFIFNKFKLKIDKNYFNKNNITNKINLVNNTNYINFFKIKNRIFNLLFFNKKFFKSEFNINKNKIKNFIKTKTKNVKFRIDLFNKNKAYIFKNEMRFNFRRIKYFNSFFILF